MSKNSHNNKKYHPLHLRFLLRSVLVLVFGVTIFEAISFYRMSSMTQQLFLENMKSSVSLSATQIDDELARLKTDLDIISGLPALSGLFLSVGYGLDSEAEQYKAEIIEFFERQRQRSSAYIGFVVCDSSNEQLVAHHPSLSNSTSSAGEQSISQCHSHANVPAHYYPKSSSNEVPMLTFHQAVIRENRILGNVTILFDLTTYFSMVESFKLYDSGFLVVADDLGKPISSGRFDQQELKLMINQSRKGVSLNDGASDGTSDNISDSIPEINDSSGRELFVYLSQLQNIDWSIAAFAYKDEMFAPLYTQIKVAILIILIMIFTEALFINFLTRRLILERINALLSATRSILDGDFQKHIELKGNDEITALSEQFNHMTASLSEKIDALNHEKEKVLQSQNQLKDIIDNSSALINIKDTDGVYQMVNQAFMDYFGASQEDIVGKTDTALFDDALASTFRKNDLQVIQSKKSIQFEESGINADGKANTFLTVKFPLLDEKDDVYATCAISTDITERIEEEKSLKQLNEKLSLSNTLLESIEEGVVIADASYNIIDLNPALEKLFEYSREELIGKQPAIFRSEVHPPSFFDELYHSLETKGSWHGEIWEKTKSGNVIPQLLTVTSMRDESGAVTHYAGIYSDISDLKKTQEKLQKLAHFDSLTGLANRVLLEERTSQAILLAQRENYKVAMLFIDLDNFKYINDTLGHDVGDELLKQAAERFKNVIRDTDTLARQGGDEFVILLSKTIHSNDAHMIAEKIREAGSRPFTINEQELYVTTSIGIAVFPDDANDTAGLLKCSDMAMYAAKDSGKNSFHFYSEKLNHAAVDRLKIERGLRTALEEDKLLVYFQPQFDAFSGQIKAFEALARWPQADGHFIPPDLFIPIAEESGLIIKLGEWIIEKSFVTMNQLEKETGNKLNLSINLSARQFRHYDLASKLKQLAVKHHFSPSRVEYEVTESLLVDDYKLAEKILNEIKSMGFSLALDDFGTGYSSLSYLKHFPLDTLKLDKIFMYDLTKDIRNQAIVSASVELGKALGMNVVCEGVETEEQALFIQSLGGVSIQGYYFSKPLPEEALLEFIEKHAFSI